MGRRAHRSHGRGSAGGSARWKVKAKMGIRARRSKPAFTAADFRPARRWGQYNFGPWAGSGLEIRVSGFVKRIEASGAARGPEAACGRQVRCSPALIHPQCATAITDPGVSQPQACSRSGHSIAWEHSAGLQAGCTKAALHGGIARGRFYRSRFPTRPSRNAVGRSASRAAVPRTRAPAYGPATSASTLPKHPGTTSRCARCQSTGGRRCRGSGFPTRGVRWRPRSRGTRRCGHGCRQPRPD